VSPVLEQRPITRWPNGGNAWCGCCSARLAIWAANYHAGTGVLLQTAVLSESLDTSLEARDLIRPLGSLLLPIEGNEIPLHVSVDEIYGRVCVLLNMPVEITSQRLVVFDLL
jgi:hypothetical protein